MRRASRYMILTAVLALVAMGPRPVGCGGAGAACAPVADGGS